MSHIVVAGITNMETSLTVEGFPLEYTKSRFAFHGVRDRPGGVGYNVARALAHLGAPVQLATLLGSDHVGDVLMGHLAEVDGLGCQGVLRTQPASLRSVILVDAEARGAMFTDLKDSQDIAYPVSTFLELLKHAGVVHATNINWAYELALEARRVGKTVSTDVQAIKSLDDAYNRRFLDVADIVFFSGENLTVRPEDVIRRLWTECDVRLAVCTMAERGAMLGNREAGTVIHQQAMPLPTPRNVTGAGDSFAAAFLWAWQRGLDPVDCLTRAQLVAGYRIGEEGYGHGLPEPAMIEAEARKRRATGASTLP